MAHPTSQMFAEAEQAASIIAAQLRENAQMVRALAEKLQRRRPPMLISCARGSSDHAAEYAKFGLETWLGIATVSQPPSVGSLYQTHLVSQPGTPFLAISQSGRSPDLLASAERAKGAGALLIALVNDTDSPLAKMADWLIPMRAGNEKAVAATKTLLASMSAIAQLIAFWSQDEELITALNKLPDILVRAWNADWRDALPMLAEAQSLYILGRGPTLSIAREAALKCKECCGLHAEAISMAEVIHGPMALIRDDFPVLIFASSDKSGANAARLAEDFTLRNARVMLCAGEHGPSAPLQPQQPAHAVQRLMLQPGLHPLLEPLAMIQSFYRLAAQLAGRRGLDPDAPPYLQKVTRTR